MYPEFLDQAAVLAVRISRITPFSTATSALPGDASPCFASLNGHQLDVPAAEAVTTMLAVAAGDLDEAGLSQWLAGWIDRES